VGAASSRASFVDVVQCWAATRSAGPGRNQTHRGPVFRGPDQLPIKWWVDSHGRIALRLRPKLLGLAVNAIPAVRWRSAPHRPNRGEVPSCIPLPPTLCSSLFDSRFRGAALALLLARMCGYLCSWLVGFLVTAALRLLLRFVGFLGSSIVGAIAFLRHGSRCTCCARFLILLASPAFMMCNFYVVLVDFRAAFLLLSRFLVVLAIRSCLHC
jgi:hypothetical protein